MVSGELRGKVYLVGAGPGDPGLLTVKARRCLEAADVVLYDRLASQAVLRYASPRAELRYVGKLPGESRTQAEINRLLVDLARQGKTVVRLKGGDPFLFGRGAEEALELARAGVPFEVVPGVSSVMATAYAGIPLTHRACSSELLVLTGHRAPESPGGRTTVVLMGWANVEEVVERLRRDYPPDAPAALVASASTPRQAVRCGTLQEVPQLARRLRAPVLLVVGEVVRLRRELAWWEELPLFGLRVLIGRPPDQLGELAERLEAEGAEVVAVPAIRVLPPEDLRPLDAALQGLGRYRWAVFTSPNGVRAALQRAQALGLDARAFAPVRIAALGPGTASVLRSWGLRPDFVPSVYRSAVLAEELPAEGPAVLFRAPVGEDHLVRRLRERGLEVHPVACYRTEVTEVPELPGVDLAVLTSGSVARALRRGYPQGPPAALCIGPETAAVARRLGWPVVAVAREHSLEGLLGAIHDWAEARRAKSSQTAT